MKHMMVIRSLIVAAAVLSVSAVTPLAASAQSERAQEAQSQIEMRREGSQESGQQRMSAEAQTHSAERREQGQARLEAAKLKACQNREKAIQTIMARTSDRADKRLVVITKISDRVQAFYVKKGKTLSNYDTLVATVNTKKQAAESAVKLVNANSTTFTCDGDNPKAVASSFKDSRKAMNAALKEYRTAVKDLIVGVKSVQGTTQRSTEGGQQ